MLKYVLVLAVILISCSPQKRLNRIIGRNPDVVKWDTLHFTDTVLTKIVKTDSIFLPTFDTIVIEKDNLIIKTVRVNDSIFIQGIVKRDTIIIEKHIPYKKYEIIPLTWWEKNKTWLITVLTILGGLLIGKKIGIL